ncbi:hypothetical protein EMPS_02346 [Entomortierella parvispora]|uniref:F-box domain-containing protein n=1 Tax=Entomortierella parvispora TaxID=205924 RepID=A0A9P3LTL5_9FUNG|nr:hypothetical protein EMPS_02346 [Entomortierella parvispora]
MMLLDATTLQGLLLYTLYFLNRLGFFRWRNTQRFSVLCQRLFRLRPAADTAAVATAVTSATSPTESSVTELSVIDHSRDHASGQWTKEAKDSDAEDAGKSSQETCPSHLIAATPRMPGEKTATRPTPRRGSSMNDMLPPELLCLIFAHLSHGHSSFSSSLYASSSYSSGTTHQHSSYDALRQGRTLRRCMLVCRTWYELIGPWVWKYPRVLWSRNWSRFYPVALSTTQFHDNKRIQIAGGILEQESGGHLLFPRAKDPLELLALGQDELHELDRHELEDWVVWRKRERYQRARECRRRRLFRKRKQPAQQETSTTVAGYRSRPRPGRRAEEDVERSDEDSDERRTGEDREDTQYACPYSDDDLDSDEDSEEDNSEDEGSLMRLVSGIDRLQSLIRSHFSPSDGPQANQIVACAKSINLPFTKALRRLRQREIIRESRRRMSEMRHVDGLPKSLPLQMCGQWIQIINLQQETSTPQKLGSQSWVHSPMSYHDSHMRRRRGQGRRFFDHGEAQQLQQPPEGQQWLGRLFSLMFTGSGERNPPGDQPPAPSRLCSRRDFVTDRTLETILEYCPGLCRLTISECQAITDEGFLRIRDSQCVARQTLVSLHLAGCHQITDRGFLGLLADRSSISTEALSFTPSVRLESLDIAGCYQITDHGLIPFLEQCGSKLKQLRVSDCEAISFRTVSTLAEHCHGIQWLDMARAGPLTDECLFSLANRCQDLEWLSLARCHPLERSGAVHTSSSEDPPETKDSEEEGEEEEEEGEEELEEEKQDSISDRCVAQICEACPNLQLLDLSYISTLTNTAMEFLAESAKNLVCLTIIGCPGITSVSLAHLARLRNTSGKLGCITMGDVQGISERDIEQIMQGTLSGWQKSLVDEANLGEILGRSWDE